MSVVGIVLGGLVAFGIGVLVGVVICEANAEKIIDRIARQQPCEDKNCISRQAVLEILKKNRYHFNISQEGYCKGKVLWSENLIKDDTYKEIEQLPPVVPIPKEKTGYWIEENINEWSRKVFCSECGCPAPFEHISNDDVYLASGYGVINKTRYCPNCGRRMVELQESEVSE